MIGAPEVTTGPEAAEAVASTGELIVLPELGLDVLEDADESGRIAARKIADERLLVPSRHLPQSPVQASALRRQLDPEDAAVDIVSVTGDEAGLLEVVEVAGDGGALEVHALGQLALAQP
jgi:hypothetical protein